MKIENKTFTKYRQVESALDDNVNFWNTEIHNVIFDGINFGSNNLTFYNGHLKSVKFINCEFPEKVTRKSQTHGGYTSVHGGQNVTVTRTAHSVYFEDCVFENCAFEDCGDLSGLGVGFTSRDWDGVKKEEGQAAISLLMAE